MYALLGFFGNAGAVFVRKSRDMTDDNGKLPISKTEGIIGYANAEICGVCIINVGSMGIINGPIPISPSHVYAFIRNS